MSATSMSTRSSAGRPAPLSGSWRARPRSRTAITKRCSHWSSAKATTPTSCGAYRNVGRTKPMLSKQLLLAWFDNKAVSDSQHFERRVEWLRTLPFIGMHLMCAGVIWVGVSRTALLVAAALYVLRLVAITGFYHRYFSHKTFRTSRVVQFVFAVLGTMAVQRGPLWW